ncbi:MAG: family 43 glycosylhydrolase, partial [Bacteroidales bacterium]|nr:family 43 glycosylhydrolase [Bacteroidales bacterium]
MRKNLILAAALLLCSAAALAQPRYCNPLPMPMGQGGNASGDVTVLQEGGKYYMYCTGGGAWVSDDLLNWEFHYVQGVPVAPDIVKYRGKFYLSGNTDNLYVADNPLGPFENLGTFKNTGPVEQGWNGGFDTKIFVDDDGQPYLFWPGRGISGIYGVKLDPDDLTKFAGTPVHLFGFNPMHAWERYGEKNEYPGVAWIEGPWVIKRGGIYYLEYSASGTQWKTYAEGYYTATSPLGPYTYAANNPLLRKTEGLVTGTAHGSIVQAPDGEWWQFYTIVLSNPPGGRRIGMDRVRFDEDGLMSVTVTDSPQPAPGFKADPDKLPSIPVTINKMLAMNALSKASS